MSNSTPDALNGLEDDYMLNRKMVERVTSLSRATIYRMMGRKEFPRGHKLSTNRVGWSVGEIRHWLRSRTR